MKSTTIPRLVILFFLLIFSTTSFSQNNHYSIGDIDLQYNFAHSYDTANCRSISEMSIDVTINNSFINDTFKVNFPSVYWRKFDPIVNTTGINPWHFVIDKNQQNKGISGYLKEELCDNEIYNNDTTYFSWLDMKLILFHQNSIQKSLDTILINTLKDTFHFVSRCGYNYALGRVYLDYNENCVFDGNDKGLNPDELLKSEINFTNCNQMIYNPNDGFWSWRISKKRNNYLKIGLNSNYQFMFHRSNCSPISYTINTFPQSGLDFALQCGTAIDLYANCNGPGRARPNQPFKIHSSVGNIGCTEASGQLKLVLDPRVTYDISGSIHPTDIVLTSPTGDTLVWNFSNLNSFSKGPYWNAFLSEIKVTPLTTVAIGDTLHFKYWTNIPSIDADSSNNQGTFDVEIRTAFDPNEKTVSPKGEGPNGNIDPTTQKLKYTIQFQNTGLDYAENIYVIDTLDAAIDPNSLRIEMTSHAMNPEWLAPNVVKFKFPNIHLLDSTTNEPASHGSVTFNVRLKPNLPIGTEIKNIGYIYFDYNAPVLTNYAVSTLFDKSASINEIENGSGIVLFPNPAQDNISIKSSIELKSAKIISTDGKIVNEFNLTNSQKNLDISSLKIGTYIVEIESTTGFIQRLKFLKR